MHAARPLHYAELLSRRRDGVSGPLGILYRESIAGYDLEAFRRAWSEVRMEQLSAEVVIIAHSLSRVIRAKYLALGGLCCGLVGLVALAVRAAGRLDDPGAHGLTLVRVTEWR